MAAKPREHRWRKDFETTKIKISDSSVISKTLCSLETLWLNHNLYLSLPGKYNFLTHENNCSLSLFFSVKL